MTSTETVPSIWAERHPSTQHFEGMFRYAHLGHGALRDLSSAFRDMAEIMLDSCQDGPELTTALRHLWDSKNNAVMQLVLDLRADGENPVNKPGVV